MSLKCPRCKLALRSVQYEGVETDMCDGCWGFWLDPGELEEVIASRELEFSAEETKTVLDYKVTSTLGPTAPAPCPRCGKVMDRVFCQDLARPRADAGGGKDQPATTAGRVHLIIDRCRDHGTWLDTGELKKAQAVAEKSDALHKLILRKLGISA